MTYAGPLEVEPLIPTDVIIFVKSIFKAKWNFDKKQFSFFKD